MALIPALNEIKDLKPLSIDECGKEYDLRIIKAREKKFNSGRNGVAFIIDIVDEDNATNIFHNLLFGNDGEYTGDEEEKSNEWWRRVKTFCRALGLDPDNDIEAEDFEDLQFTAIVEYDDGCDEDGNQVYEPSNRLGKITGH